MAVRSLAARCGLPQIIGGIAGQYYPDYAYCHPLFTEGLHIYSDSKVSEFLSTMPGHWSADFLDAWNARTDHRKRIYISYDSTNKNCRAGDIRMVEYGHPKDDVADAARLVSGALGCEAYAAVDCDADDGEDGDGGNEDDGRR